MTGTVTARQFQRAGTVFAALLQVLVFLTQRALVGIAKERQPVTQQRLGLLRISRGGEFEAGVQEHLAGELVQHGEGKIFQPVALTQFMEKPAMVGVSDPGAQVVAGLGQAGGGQVGCVNSEQHIPLPFALSYAQRPVEQGRWRCLFKPAAGREQRAELPGLAFQFGERLRAAQAQGDLPGLIEAPVKATQRLLKRRVVDRQAVTVASVECAERMARRNALQQSELPLRLGIA